MPESDNSSLAVEREDKTKKMTIGAMTKNNQYKSEYLKQFETVNKGFVDTYSMTKGGVLLKLDESKQQTANDRFQGPSEISKVAHDDDFRSVWIPKKFEGRNMFASHIGNAIFPEQQQYVDFCLFVCFLYDSYSNNYYNIRRIKIWTFFFPKYK